MSNVCNLCGKEVNGPLTAAGLCCVCSTSLRTHASGPLSAEPSLGSSTPLEECKCEPSTDSSPSSWSWRRIKKASLTGGLLSLALGVYFFVMVLTGAAESIGSPSLKMTRWVESVLGKTGSHLLLGLVTSGIGVYFITKSFEDCYD